MGMTSLPKRDDIVTCTPSVSGNIVDKVVDFAKS